MCISCGQTVPMYQLRQHIESCQRSQRWGSGVEIIAVNCCFVYTVSHLWLLRAWTPHHKKYRRLLPQQVLIILWSQYHSAFYLENLCSNSLCTHPPLVWVAADRGMRGFQEIKRLLGNRWLCDCGVWKNQLNYFMITHTSYLQPSTLQYIDCGDGPSPPFSPHAVSYLSPVLSTVICTFLSALFSISSSDHSDWKM